MTPAETFDAYRVAIAAHDIQKTMALISNDAVYLFSNETHHIGKEAVQTAIETNFQLIRDETYEVRGLRWLTDSSDGDGAKVPVPSVACCIYEYCWTGEIKGTRMSGSGRGTNVLRRETDATWMIVHEHLSKGTLGSS